MGGGEAYHGYWQQDLYALNENFGTENDLKSLSDQLHAREMVSVSGATQVSEAHVEQYLMVDVVVNHFGWAGEGTSVDYRYLNPFNEEKYFHSYCEVTSTTNMTNIDNCWLGDSIVSLPDLRTEDPTVASMYNSWISSLVSNYTIDGLRIDSVLNVEASFFPNWLSAAGVFATGEVDDGAVGFTCPFQNSVESILNYPIYFPLVRAFASANGSISDLVAEMEEVKTTCKDSTLLGSFSENHDQPRFPSLTPDMSLAQTVITYSMLADGIPIIYQGQEQHYAGGDSPSNREAIWPSEYKTSSPLYEHIATLNTIRSHALSVATNYSTYQSYATYTDANTVAMRKGYSGSQVVAVLSNLGEGGLSYTLNLTGTEYASGESIIELLTCTNLKVDTNGDVQLPMASGLPKVLYPSSLLAGSGLCGSKKATPTTTNPTSASTATSTSTHTTKSASSFIVVPGHLGIALVLATICFVLLW